MDFKSNFGQTRAGLSKDLKCCSSGIELRGLSPAVVGHCNWTVVLVVASAKREPSSEIQLEENKVKIGEWNNEWPV